MQFSAADKAVIANEYFEKDGTRTKSGKRTEVKVGTVCQCGDLLLRKSRLPAVLIDEKDLVAR